MNFHSKKPHLLTIPATGAHKSCKSCLVNHLESIARHLVQLVINVLEVDAHVCTHGHMYVHACVHACMHTHTNTNTHTHKLTFHTKVVLTNRDAAAGQHLI